MNDVQKPENESGKSDAVKNTASLGKRLLAAVIDLMSVSFVAGFFADQQQAEEFQNALIQYHYVLPPEVLEKYFAFQMQSLIILFIAFFVMNSYLLFSRGQTIGKAIMKIAIRDLNNQKPGFIHLVINRYLIQIPLMMFFLTILDIAFLLLRVDRRSIHDLIAKTKVVDLTIKVEQSTQTFMA